MFCVKCGTEVEARDDFCPNCGIRIKKTASLIEDEMRGNGDKIVSSGVARSDERDMLRMDTGKIRGRKKPKTSGWAVASLIFGIGALSFAPVLGAIFAILFALIARRDIERSEGYLRGGLCAAAGLTLGIVGILLPVALVVIFFAWGIAFRKHGGAAKDNLIGVVEVARIYYIHNKNSYSGMKARKLLEIDESLDIRDGPGRTPEVVYIEKAGKNKALLYCYSKKGRKYVAAANGDNWRFKFGSFEEQGEEWFEKLLHDLSY